MYILKVYIYFPCINTQQRATSPFNDTPVISPPHSKHLKTGIYQGSADCCEVDCDSDLNCLASVILRQYTTVTNQCYKFTWAWTWRIQYCYCWYHFNKRPSRFNSITCELLLQIDRSSVLCPFGLQPINLRWVINICLILLSLDTHFEVYLQLLYFDLLQIRQFVMFCY